MPPYRNFRGSYENDTLSPIHWQEVKLHYANVFKIMKQMSTVCIEASVPYRIKYFLKNSTQNDFSAKFHAHPT